MAVASQERGAVGSQEIGLGSSANTQTAAASAQTPAQKLTSEESNPAYLSAVSTTEADLNSNNFAGAWSSALSTSGLFGTNYNAATTDPLLQDLESGSGLQQLDPSKQWTAAEDTNFYNALGSNPVYNGKTTTGLNGTTESLGKNPYGLWGSGSDLTNGTDAKANQASGSDDPNVEQFAGATPSKSFLSKYGADIGALAATVVSFGVAAPALAGALAADGVASGLAAGAIAGGVLGAANTVAVDAITGAPITAGGVLGGALGGAAGGGLTGLAGGAINNATGLGSTLSTGIAGAGIGAARGALTGGNVGLDALTGGVGGAIQGSGVAGQLRTGLSSTTGLSTGASGAVVNGGLNYAVGGATGLAAGALGLGAASGAQNGTASSGGAQTGSSFLGAGVGGQGANGNVATSTDTALAGVIGGLGQTAVGSATSLAASNAQVGADQNAITTQQNNLGNINNIWATQQGLGQGADTTLGSVLGTNGAAPNPSVFENQPGYQFAVQQGTQAIQRQAAAMGNAYTPNTAEAVGSYVTGTASQNYNQYVNQLMGAAGLGTTANQGLQTGSQQTSNNISTLQQNIGQAQAAGISGVGSAVGSLFGVNGAGTSLLNGALGGTNSSGTALGQAGTAPATGDVSGGVDSATGVPTDLESGTNGSGASTFDPSNPLGIAGYSDTSGLQLGTDSTFNSVTGAGDDSTGDLLTNFLGG
jgi:hypothetical protein